MQLNLYNNRGLWSFFTSRYKNIMELLSLIDFQSSSEASPRMKISPKFPIRSQEVDFLLSTWRAIQSEFEIPPARTISILTHFPKRNLARRLTSRCHPRASICSRWLVAQPLLRWNQAKDYRSVRLFDAALRYAACFWYTPFSCQFPHPQRGGLNAATYKKRRAHIHSTRHPRTYSVLYLFVRGKAQYQKLRNAAVAT